MKKKASILITALCLLFCVSVTQNTVFAAEAEETSNDSAAITPFSFSQTGVVTGDGVRLRANPNTSSTILELMYWGDEVLIDLENSTMTFYYVKRVSTGTCGYVSRDYVSFTYEVR